MRAKRRISLKIDTNVYEAVENASRTYNLERSRIIQQALELWFQKETEKSMAEGYEATYDEDREFAAISFEAQRENLT